MFSIFDRLIAYFQKSKKTTINLSWFGTKYSKLDQVKYVNTAFKKLKGCGLPKADHTPSSKFLMAVSYNFYSVNSWILYPICFWWTVVLVGLVIQAIQTLRSSRPHLFLMNCGSCGTSHPSHSNFKKQSSRGVL